MNTAPMGDFLNGFPSLQAGINPGKYAAERAQGGNQNPLAPNPRASGISQSTLVFVIGLVVVIWLLERHRLGLKLGLKA